jgi:ABC-type dipeptide/oligopeptide/nickel transport system ATPase component
MREVLLEIRDLRTYFFTEDGVVKAINGVNLEIASGETLGLVGESGSGKSVTALSILRLIQDPPGKIVSGQILFKGDDLLTYPTAQLRRDIRGREIAMIFQDPMVSLNPVFTVGSQLAEAIYLHQFRDQRAALQQGVDMLREAGAPGLEGLADLGPAPDTGTLWQRAVQRGIRMMEAVGIPSARDRVIDYPHQFSGGMRQRIMIAMAISCHPSLLIADEPTTALDVTIQVQILEIMKTIKRTFGASILLITHNLGVIAEMADRVAVMYAGNIVEYNRCVDPVLPAEASVYRGLTELLPRGGRPPETVGINRGGGAGPDQPSQRVPVSPALQTGHASLPGARAAAAAGGGWTSGELPSLCCRADLGEGAS